MSDLDIFGGMPKTEVRENARLELLRMLALWRDVSKGKDPFWPRSIPLFEGEWENKRADIILAAKEAAKLGQITMHVCDANGEPHERFMVATRGGFEAFVTITDAGYDFIHTHDLVREIEQEAPRLSAEKKEEGGDD